MKIRFSKQSTAQIIAAIRSAMEGRSLGEIVSISEISDGLEVKISKLGTSVLQFQRSDEGDHAILKLASEKIAFAHKAFKEEVKQKLVHVIEKSGGKVELA